MARKFAEITFTPAVRAAQAHNGTRAANRRFEADPDGADSAVEGDRLGPREAAFVAARDGFFQATVSETGWPYVQFRGGPAGFLKVLDDRTLGYADFRGNLQYISVGNLAADDRVSLILMDQARRKRLKIWARARVVDAADEPELVARLAVPGYPATVERAVVLTVEALDWNCPQHITPRFTEAEVAEAVAPLRARIAELEDKLANALGYAPPG
ncbi:MAG: pyridoxamine 5'-phosphate oxidase family protein [Azospirillaceae bacterium]